ncbi:MAG TPA: YARHG domain-containing protein [Chthoniobacterales bacterium]|nr:YARHG domain-containing protein [Chthoniobacterales bacterium]
MSSEPYATFVGERYPDTRTRIFSPEELQSWSTDQLRYAINEVFARHGASFPQSIANQFRQFTWYRERPGITFDEIERSALSDIERQNLKVFSSVRNQKGTSVPVTKLFAGRWNGIIRMYLIPPAGPQQVFDDRYTFEIADDESSIRYTDEHSNPSPPWPLLRNGRNGFWQDFGRAADGSVSGQGVGNFIVAQNGTVAKVTINSVASNGVRITQVGTVRRTK